MMSRPQGKTLPDTSSSALKYDPVKGKVIGSARTSFENVFNPGRFLVCQSGVFAACTLQDRRGAAPDIGRWLLLVIQAPDGRQPNLRRQPTSDHALLDPRLIPRPDGVHGLGSAHGELNLVEVLSCQLRPVADHFARKNLFDGNALLRMASF
jgi:hypothetical protein